MENIKIINDFIEYLNLLQQNLGAESFVINLDSTTGKHIIALAWDAKKRSWLLIDPNHLPGENYTHTPLLAQAVLYDLLLFSPFSYYLYSRISTNAQHAKAMRGHYEELQKIPIWARIHHLSQTILTEDRHKTLQEFSTNRSNRFQAAWTDQKLVQTAIEKNLDEVFIKFIEKNKANTFLKQISNSTLNELIRKIAPHVREKLFEQMTVEEKALRLFDSELPLLSQNEWLPVFLVRQLNNIEHSNAREEINKCWSTMTPSELLSVFLQLPEHRQGALLLCLSGQESWNEHRLTLLQALSIEQKVNIFEQMPVTRSTKHDGVIELFLSIPPSFRLALVKRKLTSDSTFMKRVADDFQCLQALIHSLEPEQTLEAIQSRDENERTLLSYTTHAECMELMLNLYPLRDRLDAVSEGIRRYSSETILDHAINFPPLLNVILKHLPLTPDESETEVSPKVLLLFKTARIAYHSECLQTMCRGLSEAQCLRIALQRMENDSLIQYAAQYYPPLLNELLHRLTPNALMTLIDDKQTPNLLLYAVENEESLTIILNTLQPNQRLELLMSKNHADESALYFIARHNPNALLAVLKTLNIEERFIVLQQEIDAFNSPVLCIEMKKIMLDQIKSINPEHSRLDELEHTVQQALSFSELKAVFEVLNSQLEDGVVLGYRGLLS